MIRANLLAGNQVPKTGRLCGELSTWLPSRYRASRAQGPPANEEGRAEAEQEVDDARLRTQAEGEHSPGDQGDQSDQERHQHRIHLVSVDGVGVGSYFTLE
jgi:hypothetical protein